MGRECSVLVFLSFFRGSSPSLPGLPVPGHFAMRIMKKFHEPTFLRDDYYGAECADTLSMSISLVEWPLPVVGVTRVNGVRGNYLLIDSQLCNKMSCH
jgi:hypothetical protein